MPLHHVIDHDSQLVHAEGSALVTVHEICDYLDDVVVQGAMPYRKLFDLSRCEVNIDDSSMMALGTRVAAYAAFEPRGAVAIVAVTDRTVFEAQRLFNLGGATRPGRIFASVDAAREWLVGQGQD